MTNASSSAVLDDSSADTLAPLRQAIASGSLKKQLAAIPDLVAAGEPGLALLMATATAIAPGPVSMAAANVLLGRLYQALWQTGGDRERDFLNSHYPNGVLSLPSDCKIDYQPIQTALARGEFEDADHLTLRKLCELASPDAVKRKWLYFTEIERFPTVDLQAIDALWLVYSEGKFGFSVQRRIWLAVGQNWDQLWPKIHWKNGNHWTRWPSEFTWNLSAPEGHLPLTNQLRGVRVMESLMNHPAWQPSPRT